MKIIRPEYTPEQPKKVENTPALVKKVENLVDDKTNINDYIMTEVLENTKDITFNITLTKKQYELWQKKGGIKWLKKALVGQRLNKKR